MTVSDFVPLAATLAPSQSSLDARSAQSVISPQYIENFTSPNRRLHGSRADGARHVQFQLRTEQAWATARRSFAASRMAQYTMTFDGIPFNDTNSSDPSLVGVLSQVNSSVKPFSIAARDRLHDRSDELRRLDQHDVPRIDVADQKSGDVYRTAPSILGCTIRHTTPGASAPGANQA